MKDEIWLQRLKERLDSHTEPAPISGWERLEDELRASKKTHSLMSSRRWYAAAVAAMITGIVAFIGLRLTDGSSISQDVEWPAHHPLTTADALPAPPAPSAQIAASAQAVAPSRPVSLQRHAPDATANIPPAPAAKDDFLSHHVPVEESPAHAAVTYSSSEKEEKQEAAVASEQHRSSPKTHSPKISELPETDNRLLAQAERPSKARSKNWSVSLSAGNSGGLGSSLDHAGLQSMAQNAPGTGFAGIDFTATSNGIISIPEGQELIFKNGIPYLQHDKRQIVSADHKQPVSVGLSVRKNLPHGFSIETGLAYTLLISDLYFENAASKTRQKLHYLGIPLRANWNFIDKKDFILYLSAGGMIEKCIYGKIGTQTETVDPVQWSVLASLGAQYNISSRVGIYIEPGISHYFDDGSDFQTIRKESPCNFTLQAGLRLSY